MSTEFAHYRGRAGEEGTPNPTSAYISILMGMFSKMFMALNEQKVTIDQSGAVVLLLVFTFYPISSLLLLAQGYLSLCSLIFSAKSLYKL